MEIEDRRGGVGDDALAELHRLGQHHLFLRGEERHAGDLPEVEPRGVLDVEEVVVLGGLDHLVGVGVVGRRRRRRRGRDGAPGRLGLRDRDALEAEAVGRRLELEGGEIGRRGVGLELDARPGEVGGLVDQGGQDLSMRCRARRARPPVRDVRDAGFATDARIRRGEPGRVLLPPGAGHTCRRVKC
jgi:hypothetical protein